MSLSCSVVMRLLLLLACVAFTGCHANLVWHNPPQRQVDMVKDAFWDYVAKATRTAEDSLRQIRESELGTDLNSLISRSTDAVNKFTDTLQTQVAPATVDLMSKLTQEAERLKARLEKDLTEAGGNAQPYAQELVSNLQRQVEELRREAAPYAEALDPEALKAVLLQKSQELQENLAPYGEELKEQLDADVQKLKEQLSALWEAFSHMVQ
ncbi:hypothetical protein INR49_006771 [Caranx melampygus]|nr:hypothetical protein INR49_006771 [Caranx melampygus]